MTRIVCSVAVLLALVGCAHTEKPAAETKVPPPSVSPSVVAQLETQARAATEKKNFAEAQRLHAELFSKEPEVPAHAYDAACAAAQLGQKDSAFNWLERAIDKGFTGIGWMKRDPDLQSLQKDERWPPLFTRMKAVAERRAKELDVGGGLTKTTPAQAGLDQAALDALVEEAQKSKSTALVVLRDGHVAGEWYFGTFTRPIEAMSATKSVVALCILKLLSEGKLKGLDEPLWHYFPELKQGLKEKLTLRHLLNHTTGIQADRTTEEIYRSSDFVQLALAADLENEPGARFFYNNKAVNLLSGLVERASGQRLDVYAKEKLFGPMGIKDVQWTLDKAGHAHGMSGLQIHPIDFAKLGQLMLDGGTWKGTQLIPRSWIDEATTKAGQSYEPESGLLWWLRYQRSVVELPGDSSRLLTEKKVDAGLVKAVKEVEGKPMERDAFWSTLSARLPDAADVTRTLDELKKVQRWPQKKVEGPLQWYSANGFLGQYVIVYPAQKLVVVRMVESEEGQDQQLVTFPSAASLGAKLVPAK